MGISDNMDFIHILTESKFRDVKSMYRLGLNENDICNSAKLPLSVVREIKGFSDYKYYLAKHKEMEYRECKRGCRKIDPAKIISLRNAGWSVDNIAGECDLDNADVEEVLSSYVFY